MVRSVGFEREREPVVKITILAYLDAGAEKPDVAIEQVQQALDAGGHETSLLTVHDDVSEIIDGLQKPKPDLVFNLLESFADDIIGGQMGVAGVLDLLQIPYTGGGPGELYLQEDKALAKKLLAYEQVLYPDFATFAPNAEFETGGNLRMPLFVKPLRMDASIGIDETLAGPQHPGTDGAGAAHSQDVRRRGPGRGVHRRARVLRRRAGQSGSDRLSADRDGFFRPARGQPADHGQRGEVRRERASDFMARRRCWPISTRS